MSFFIREGGNGFFDKEDDQKYLKSSSFDFIPQSCKDVTNRLRINFGYSRLEKKVYFFAWKKRDEIVDSNFVFSVVVRIRYENGEAKTFKYKNVKFDQVLTRFEQTGSRRDELWFKEKFMNFIKVNEHELLDDVIDKLDNKINRLCVSSDGNSLVVLDYRIPATFEEGTYGKAYFESKMFNLFSCKFVKVTWKVLPVELGVVLRNRKVIINCKGYSIENGVKHTHCSGKFEIKIDEVTSIHPLILHENQKAKRSEKVGKSEKKNKKDRNESGESNTSSPSFYRYCSDLVKKEFEKSLANKNCLDHERLKTLAKVGLFLDAEKDGQKEYFKKE